MALVSGGKEAWWCFRERWNKVGIMLCGWGGCGGGWWMLESVSFRGVLGGLD